MSLTIRERQGALRFVILWALVSVFAATAGPFGTFEGLGLLERLGYWGGIVGASILLTHAQQWLIRGRAEHLRLLAQLPYAGILALLAHGMNLLIFPHWGGWQDFGFLLVVTLSVVLLIEITVFLLRNYALQPAAEATQQEVADTVNAEQRFLRRLPLDKRGPLIRLEAQDHYLLVVTERGQETLLMRLGDAAAELAETGLRVHRSHWVAPTQVRRHARQKGRDFLQMKDESLVPVSRSCRPAAQAAGLL